MRPDVSVALTLEGAGAVTSSILVLFDKPDDAEMQIEDAVWLHEELGRAIARAQSVVGYAKGLSEEGGGA